MHRKAFCIISEWIPSYALAQNPNHGDSICGTIEFSSGDMYYSIQKCNYNGIISRDENGKLIADIIINDVYDFTEIRSGKNGSINFGSIINDLGYMAQMTGLGTPYSFQIHFSVALE